MSKSLGQILPSELLELLASETPPPLAFPVVSLDRTGFPHCMILSLHEVLYQNGRLYLLIPPQATSAHNLKHDEKMLLIFFHPPHVTYLKARAMEWKPCSEILILEIDIEEVLSDQPTEAEKGAELISGLEFQTSPADLQRRTQLREKARKLLT